MAKQRLGIAEKIRNSRKTMRPKVSQERLAEALNVDPMVISRWERGVNLPSYENLTALADFFSQPISYFLDDSVKATRPTYESESNEHIVNALSVLTKENQALRQEVNFLRTRKKLYGDQADVELLADLRSKFLDMELSRLASLTKNQVTRLKAVLPEIFSDESDPKVSKRKR